MKNKLNLFRQYAGGLVKFLFTITFLLTLCVGQMWAEPWVKLDVSTGSQGTKTVGDKLNGGSEWWFNYQTNGGWSTGTDIQVLIGTSSSSYSTVNASWYADDGDNKKVHANIGNFEFTKSGKWYAVGKYKSGSTTAYTSGTSWTSNTSLSTSMSTSNSPYWTVNPPSVKSFAVSTTGSDILSGSGTNADPYIISYNGSLVLSLSGSKNKTDDNSSLQYNTAGTWNSTTSRTISSITSTTKTSVTVKMRCYNSTASLSGTESSKEIYYKSEASYSVTAAKTPSVGGSVTPSSATNMGVTSGGTITADPNDGYTFGGWAVTSGSGSFEDDSEESTTFYPTAASTVTATFDETMSTVSFVASPTGKGTFTVGGSTVTSTTAGVTTTKSVTAVPISGYRFTGWSISGGASISSTSDNPTTVTGAGAGAAATLTATFEEDLTYYRLKFGARSGETSYGTVAAEDGSGDPLTSNTDYLSGTSVTVTATATDDDYKFDSWYDAWTSGSSVSTDNPLTFTLTAATDRYAHFVRKTTSITLNKNNGSGGTAGPVTATHGNTTLSTSPLVNPSRSGYTFTGYWTESSGGVKVIDTDGYLVASVSGYTKSGNKKWDYDEPTLTLYAQWTENLTTVTISASPAGTGTLTLDAAAFTPGNTTTAGVTTSHSVVATAANDYAFSSWSVTGNATGTSSTNTYTLKGNGSGSTGTLTANFTLIPCKLYKVSAAKNGSTTDKGAMSYDATEHAYYKDITTDASPYYFRFYYNNSAQYCTDWSSKAGGDAYTSGKHVSANDSKEDCDQSVGGWGDKPAMYYSGASGTTIRIWFDYQNKKVWITADKDKQYVLRGSKYDESGNGGLPGWSATDSYLVGLASGNTGSITATLNAATEYKIKLYDLYSPAWMGNTSTSSETTMSDGTLYTMYSGDSYKNFVFTTTIAGTYTFTLDKSSGKKIKVDFPASYQLNYDIGTVKGTSGSISTDPTTASGSYVPSGNTVTLTAPEAKTGYEWSGWFTNEAGTEGQIADVDRVITVTMNANKTLYACYTENEYPVTVSTGANGDVSPKGTVNVKQISGTSLTATPNTGYHFDHWAISGGGITPSSSTTSPQTFKATETGGTIQAIFAETTYTVNVNSGNANFGSVSTTSVSGIGISTTSGDITATPETGATFVNWTIPAGVTLADGYLATDATIRIHASSSGKAITANFSETKHTATITTANGSHGTVSPTSASVGQITAVQITASKKTGYMFAGWEQTAGSGTVTYHVAAGAGSSVDATGNTQSITYITIDGDVTLQATWEEDRSAGWFLRGTWSGGWTTGGQKAFIKNEGETAGTVSYVRWTLAPEMFTDATMQMKMYDGSTYYGHSTDFDAAGNLCTKDNNNSNITFYSGVAYQNFKVSIPVAGEYIFRWDSSTKQLTITYPAGNFIRGTFDSWSWDHVLEPTGNANEYSCVISMTGDKAPHAWTGSDGFKVVLAGDHYGKNSTGITRASNSASSLSREGNNINWTTDVRGDYTFTVNSSSKTVTVTYPSAYTVTYGCGEGGSSVSASATSVGGTFSSGAYVAAGDDITFTQTPVDGNTFKGWYDAASGGDAISCMASDNVYDDIAGNINVYAQYTPTTYTNVTLNATTGSTNGAYSVTFGGTTITVTTDPLKTGYEPEGFYESYADGNWTNKIAASDGTLQSGTTYTDATGHWKATNSPTLYTKWQPKTYTVTLDKNGSSAGYLTNGSVTATYDSNTLTSLTVPTRTGYHLVDGYYKEPGLTNKIINLNGTLCTSTAYTDASGNWTNDGAVSLYAKWEANTYTITFDPASGTVDPTSASVTFDAAVSNAPVPTRTGYTFIGYNTAGGASITTNAGVFKSSVDGFTDGSAHWVQPDDATITAQWTANPYTITLTQSTETGYGSAGTTSVGATFDAALPTIASLPTAANGYAFMGYFTDHNGVGTQYYDADGTKLVASYTTADNLELFAYFKKAEITAITFSPAAVVAPNATITATPTISPTPTGTTNICWRVLYSNGNPLAEQPTFTPVSGNTVSFPASATSGSYKLEAVLHLGSGCGGTELSTYVANFQVAGDHEVTVQYKDAEGNTIQASGTVTGRPLAWSSEITAPDIFGYTFARWEAGDGVTLSKDGSTDHAFDTAQVASIYIKAVYDGRLTAVYNQNQMIYFKNTLGWENVFVNFHTGDAWVNTNNPQSSPKGVGNSGLSEKNRNNHMIQIGESDIYYYDYGAESISPSLYISFTNKSRDGVAEFWGDNPDGIAVVYPANYADAISTDKSSENGFKAATPMFVPLAPQTPVAKNVTPTGKANYYNSGYWTTYTAGTGYTLEIYYDNDGSACIYSIPFTSADDLMPMTAKVDLEASTTYRYQVRRGGTESAGIYYGNTGTMTYDNHGDGTGWIMENTMAGGFKKAKITTNASGDYTFNLSYSANNESQYRLRMKVDYPIANNDYRLVYSDATQTKPIISAIVTKANNSKDTVSFFIRPASAALVIQQASVTKEGAITWNYYSTITSSVSGLAKDSVYNICLTMNESGAISVENVEAYTGNFYIRTNAAGSSKWDNFRSSDHLMTYSEYSATNADYSHYFMAYVGNGTNVKFVVANDYAPNISDTVIVQTYRGGDASHVNVDGDIQADANVRFMWNRHNNGAYRAYLAAAKSDGSKFLVLRANSDTDLMDENGNALINSANSGEAGYNHKAPDNSIQFVDDDNWIYKATVKVKPSAFVKLYAYFNSAYFYYKGKNNDDFDDAENAIQLMTGTGEAEKIHVIYDFKTDRLVAAWIPSGNISEEREIHADVMFVREHQGDIEQLTFTGSGAITEIKTAYAVLRFNKWTLNNKSKAAGHAVLNPGASRYERDLFYVSFPFRVSMEEVFGFGKYGQHWIVEEYDGEARAANGFWADTPSYWRFITNRKGKFFEPNKGYIIALDLDELGESSDVWNNGVENVELYFPSYGTMSGITNATVVHTLPAHAYDPAAHPTHTDDRSIKDSHWNVMSVPTYVNTKNVEFANTTWTATKPSFLYEWNMDDNSLTARSGSGYTYHAMHAYIVQYAGDVTWTSTSVTPSSIVARRTYAEAPSEVEFCLELQQNEKTADHTFVRLSNDEEVSAGFAFGEDMSKEFNKTRSNIYTFIGTEQVAGNIMPMTEQTTVVPVGVIAKTAGDYTFAIPEGTNGVGVTLIDTETGVRTSLSALDYTVNLGAGTYNERFVLEISPVQQTPTGIENSEVSHQHSDVRKVLIDGILYIVKDGKMFDATGALVK